MCYRARAPACCIFSRQTIQLISAGKWMVNPSLNETYRDLSVQDAKWNTSENTENCLQDPDTGGDKRDAQAAWPGFSATSSNLGRKFGLPGFLAIRMCDLRLFEHTGASFCQHFIDTLFTLTLYCSFLKHPASSWFHSSRIQPDPTKPPGDVRASNSSQRPWEGGFILLKTRVSVEEQAGWGHSSLHKMQTKIKLCSKQKLCSRVICALLLVQETWRAKKWVNQSFSQAQGI